jgi:hypothetical protein
MSNAKTQMLNQAQNPNDKKGYMIQDKNFTNLYTAIKNIMNHVS